MKSTNLFKTLGLVAVTSLAMSVGAVQADDDHHKGRFGGNPYLTSSYGGPGPGVNAYRPDFRPGGDHHRFGPPRHASFSAQVEQRQDRQMDRIQHGIAQGEISTREAAKLFRQQREIEHMQRHFLADGHLTRYEYATLDRALDNASANIRHQAHDNEWRW